MEDWDKYCGITKNARLILNNLEPTHIEHQDTSKEPEKQ